MGPVGTVGFLGASVFASGGGVESEQPASSRMPASAEADTRAFNIWRKSFRAIILYNRRPPCAISHKKRRRSALNSCIAPFNTRRLLTLLRILPEVERSGDLAEHIARRAARGLGVEMSPRSRGLVERMGEVASTIWREATDVIIDGKLYPLAPSKRSTTSSTTCTSR